MLANMQDSLPGASDLILCEGYEFRKLQEESRRLVELQEEVLELREEAGRLQDLQAGIRGVAKQHHGENQCSDPSSQETREEVWSPHAVEERIRVLEELLEEKTDSCNRLQGRLLQLEALRQVTCHLYAWSGCT